jgi:hypothetical protein
VLRSPFSGAGATAYGEGMAVALFVAFLVAALHPGDRPTPGSRGEVGSAKSEPEPSGATG